MEVDKIGRLKVDNNRAPEMSYQSGFPSPATHYAEPSIDLAKELIGNQNATFFVRVAGDNLSHFNIHDKDVLIIDRSLDARVGKLALVVEEGDFKIIRIKNNGSTPFTFWGMITYIIHSAL